MPMFAKGVPRIALLIAAVAAFCLISSEVLARGPNLCVWRWIFHLKACPACGSTRALAAFFHGRFAQAWAFNRNIVITGPSLVFLLAHDFACLLFCPEPSPRPAANTNLARLCYNRWLLQFHRDPLGLRGRQPSRYD